MSIPNTPMLSCPKINSAQHSHKGNRLKALQIYPSSAHNKAPHLACFTYSIKTHANKVKFAHQAICNPKISSLLKAVQLGFLKGCPNMSKKLILKYLNASPATAKGHMKRPRHGIQSTTPKRKDSLDDQTPNIVPELLIPALLPMQPVVHDHNMPNLIGDEDNSKTIAIFFCFGTFADKHSGVVYNNLTAAFPFMSLDECMSFFVLYHYKLNAILVTSISGMDDVSIFDTYKKQFDVLTTKSLKPKIIIMDNEVTKHIKNFLTEHKCQMQLVKPHNHQMKVAKRAIQTYKDRFIAALATTDKDFPIQLWDKLAPQVQDTLNLLRALIINPAISAYKILNGLYDWNRYPLALLGCKAVVYNNGDSRGSWASQGVNGWYLGPSHDHYRCDLYYKPEMWAYWISCSTEHSPQH
jgi:hypothetical protein